jgi:hypothetical protein
MINGPVFLIERAGFFILNLIEKSDCLVSRLTLWLAQTACLASILAAGNIVILDIY